MLYAKNLVIGGEYHKFATDFLGIPKPSTGVETSNLVMHRVSNIVKIELLNQSAREDSDGSFTSAFE